MHRPPFDQSPGSRACNAAPPLRCAPPGESIGHRPLHIRTVSPALCTAGEYCDLSKFKRIYVVDLCKALCEQVSEQLCGAPVRLTKVSPGCACAARAGKLLGRR